MTEKRLFELFVGNHYGIKSMDGEVIIDSIISIGDADVLVDWLNALYDENEQLKQQMQRLYNYFADWFDGRVPPSDFSEMWDFVKEDEKWD